MKEKIKAELMKRLHCVPTIQRDCLEHVLTQGIANYLSFDYEQLKRNLLCYIESMKIGEYRYKYASSCTVESLYASAYACMMLGYLGELGKYTVDEKKAWKEYFDSFQSDKDGLFYPPELLGDAFEGNTVWGDGWGKRHLAAHLIIAYAKLEMKPKFRVSCYDFLYEEGNLERWKRKFLFADKAWSESNYIMNAYSIMQYNRDYFADAKAAEIIVDIKQWLRERINPETGMWNTVPLHDMRSREEAVRAAYHLFPIFAYDGELDIFDCTKAIDVIIACQNSWGGFTLERMVAGACEDIDAVDPLIRYAQRTEYALDKVNISLRKAMIWILANYNSDGGATFYIENEHHYGDHPATSSTRNESNMFATWFRTLCIAYMCDYLKIDNGFCLGRYPGYEIALED